MYFFDQSYQEVVDFLKMSAVPPFRAKQLFEWIYQKGVINPYDIHVLPKKVQTFLIDSYQFDRPKIHTHLVSKDGTQKWLLRFADDKEVEMVFIPEEERGTLCISSQVGCTLTCKFCHTGTQKLVRNLTSGEILSQILVAKDSLKEWKSDKRFLTNIVLMGMGEPLFNYPNVAKAMKMLMHPQALGWSKRRITLSTSGIVPYIEECGKELGINLAISLHAPYDELRTKIMPVNKKYPLNDLIKACQSYAVLSKGRPITFEYVMLEGVNDSEKEALACTELLKDFPAKMNLIPFNPWPGSFYKSSSIVQIQKFSSYLESKNIQAPIRRARGEDIFAACGQLKSESQKGKKSDIL